MVVFHDVSSVEQIDICEIDKMVVDVRCPSLLTNT